MLVEQLESLLVLQERDRAVDQLKETLTSVPLERARAEAGIVAENSKLAYAQQAFKQLEVERHSKENEIAAAEEKIRKYLTQQAQVKKNDEYQALTKEIETVKELISDLEDAVLGLMEDIDRQRDVLKEITAVCQEQIRLHQADLAGVQRREDNARADLDAALTARTVAAAAVAQPTLQQYEYVRSQGRKPPIVVPMRDNTCQGCHLKVSGAIESRIRMRVEWVRCERCGRLLYLP